MASPFQRIVLGFCCCFWAQADPGPSWGRFAEFPIQHSWDRCDTAGTDVSWAETYTLNLCSWKAGEPLLERIYGF